MTIRNGLVAACVLCAVSTSAQAPAPKTAPATEIFLASFKEGEKKTRRIALLVFQSQGVKVGKPVKITNKPADDYRPFFLPDSSGVVFASSGDGKPGGMRRYDIETKVLSELDTTPAKHDARTAGRDRGRQQGEEPDAGRFAHLGRELTPADLAGGRGPLD